MNLQFLSDITPRKVKVNFVRAFNRESIGMDKINLNELPFSFNKPTIIEWREIQWRVLMAEPGNADEFSITRKLTLHVQENNLVDHSEIGFNEATICDDRPVVTRDRLYDSFVIYKTAQQWKQFEFVPQSIIPIIEEEIEIVRTILFPTDGRNTLLGYKQRHQRRGRNQTLAIHASKFHELVGNAECGDLHFDGKGYVGQGMAWRSDNHTYYGLVNTTGIAELFVDTFDSVDEELYRIINNFSLALVDWCGARIITI